VAATSPMHDQSSEQPASVGGGSPAASKRTPDRVRLMLRRVSRGWRGFFLSGPGTDFAVYPPPERPVVIETAGPTDPEVGGSSGGLRDVPGDQLAVAATGPLRRDGSTDGPLSALARRLGPGRLASVRWTAGSGHLTITAGPCPPRRWAPGGPWSFAEADPGRAGDLSSVADEVAAVFAPPSGARRGSALDLEVSYRVGPDRDWTSLWGATALALGLTSDGDGGLLAGSSVVRSLALHRLVDLEIGDGVRIGLWWRPAGPGSTAAVAARRAPTPVPAPAPVTFDRDDAGYLAWISSNPAGYVLNAPRRSAPARGVTVHRAACRLVSGDGGGARRWTATSKKVCSEVRAELVAWARTELGAEPMSCRICGA